MRTIAQDPNTGDWNLTGTASDLLVNSAACVAQTIITTLNLWQGDWFLDPTAGMPWMQSVVGYNTRGIYDRAIQEQILSVTGVTGITSYSSSLDTKTRLLTVTATVQTAYGPASISTSITTASIGFGITPFGTDFGE